MAAQPPTSAPGRPAFPAGRVGVASGASGVASGVGGVASGPGTDPPEWPVPEVVEPARRWQMPTGRRALFWYGGAAGLALVIGLAVVLTLLLSGELAPSQARPSDVRPPLARLCPAPTAANEPPSGAPLPVPRGPRTTDETAGISYTAYGAPWEPWPLLWKMGTLEVPYGVGQHFITETYWAGDYHASILSAAVPATVNDSTAIDLECTGRQVAADVRAEYYPQPNEMELMRDERTVLGGRPAWVTKFRLHFNEDGLRAKDELVAVALIDVGRPTVAVLYVSIPGTHTQWDHVVDEALASVRPT